MDYLRELSVRCANIKTLSALIMGFNNLFILTKLLRIVILTYCKCDRDKKIHTPDLWGCKR